MDKITPYLTEDGTLIIPFECSDHSYKYWKKESKGMDAILKELGASEEVWAKYTYKKFPGTDDEQSPEE